MIYLSGVLNDYMHPRYGFIITPRRRQPIPSIGPVAADNDCFNNPESYSDERYEAFLRTMPPERTLFATAADVLGDHAATVQRSKLPLRKIRAIGLKAAFVAQDGWNEKTTPWDEFDVLFVGGTTEFKFRAGRHAAIAAKRRGKAVHMGRVNSLRRLRAAFSIGCDTVDGTFLKFAPDKNWTRFCRWFDSLERQHEMRL